MFPYERENLVYRLHFKDKIINETLSNAIVDFIDNRGLFNQTKLKFPLRNLIFTKQSKITSQLQI